jgi:hypothetical protein
MQSQQGFAAIESVLVLLAIAIIVGTGWYIWRSVQNVDKTDNQAVAVSQPTTQAKKFVTTTDSKTELTTYKNYVGKFIVQYPSSWIQPVNQQACSGILDRDLEIGPNATSVIKCGGDGTVSQVSIASLASNQTGNKDDVTLLRKSGYNAVQKSSVTVKGVKGVSYQAIAAGQGEGIGAMPDGTILIEEVLFAHGNTYIASYTQYPATEREGPNLNEQAQFQQIVNSLTFN